MVTNSLLFKKIHLKLLKAIIYKTIIKKNMCIICYIWDKAKQNKKINWYKIK